MQNTFLHRGAQAVERKSPQGFRSRKTSQLGYDINCNIYILLCFCHRKSVLAPANWYHKPMLVYHKAMLAKKSGLDNFLQRHCINTLYIFKKYFYSVRCNTNVPAVKNIQVRRWESLIRFTVIKSKIAYNKSTTIPLEEFNVRRDLFVSLYIQNMTYCLSSRIFLVFYCNCDALNSIIHLKRKKSPKIRGSSSRFILVLLYRPWRSRRRCSR